jgi:UDP-2,4-diacetamido-2,4,6-trideoxy-beta-L-altropyranose hydrolase
MPKIGILCKASFSQGMGHLVRQTHIANCLRERGAEIIFFIPEYAPAQNWLDAYPFPYQIQDSLVITNKETEPLDLILLDIQDTSETFIKKIRPGKKPVVSFEDLGAGRYHVDLLIDCNRDDDPSIKLPVQTLFGHTYSVLAPEFETFHRQKRIFNQPIKSVLLTLGGTDPHSLTATLAQKLLQVQPDLCITLLAGPGCENIATLKDLKNQNETVRLIEATSQMAQTLFDHDAVFCAGGVTLHEAMAVGTPAFVINQVSHQVEKARRAEQQGAAMNLGVAEFWDDSRLPEILKLHPKVLDKMSQAGKRLIDGKGLKRVVDAIERQWVKT